MSEEKSRWKAKLQTYVLKGDYASAWKLAREALRRDSRDFDHRFQYAKLLGDWADELPPERRRKYKREALDILRPLVRGMRGRSPDERFSVSLNLYYQAEDFRGMHRFGRRFARRHGRRGFYAQALGAGYLAMEAHREKRTSAAKGWARRATAAWKRYGLSGEKYYFPHYSEAMALAILGEAKPAMRSLRRAAKLSRRSVKDWEFADVLALIAG